MSEMQEENKRKLSLEETFIQKEEEEEEETIPKETKQVEL